MCKYGSFSYNLSCFLEPLCQSETPAAALPAVQRRRVPCTVIAEPGAGPGCSSRGVGGSGSPAESADAAAPAPHTCVCTQCTCLFPAELQGFVLFNGVQRRREFLPLRQGQTGTCPAAPILPQGKALQLLPPGSCLQRNKTNTSVLNFLKEFSTKHLISK